MDATERDILISAPIERVWAVATEPEHVGVWFGSGEPDKLTAIEVYTGNLAS
jgi:uncharacterized protein YndB with AHSA1/START domain